MSFIVFCLVFKFLRFFSSKPSNLPISRILICLLGAPKPPLNKTGNLPKVFAIDWERRATGQTYVEYFGTVVRTGEVASMLMLRDYTAETDFQGVTVKSIQTERLFNCKENITRVKKYDGYSEEMGMGELVLEKAGDNEWEKIKPSTFLQYALRTACLG